MLDARKTHAAAVDALLDQLTREQILNRILERALSEVIPGTCGHDDLLSTLRALHTPLNDGWSPTCFECGVASPCRTLLLLTAPPIDTPKKTSDGVSP